MKKTISLLLTACLVVCLLCACDSGSSAGGKITGIYLSPANLSYQNMRPQYNYYLTTFTQQELTWIGRMEKYLLEESVLNVSVFEEDSRFKSAGGFKKINRVFQGQLESVVLELNEYLYDDGGRSA